MDARLGVVCLSLVVGLTMAACGSPSAENSSDAVVITKTEQVFAEQPAQEQPAQEQPSAETKETQTRSTNARPGAKFIAGMAEQTKPGGGINDIASTYPVEFMYFEERGTAEFAAVNYPTLGCKGVLAPTGSGWQETIIEGNCDPKGIWKIEYDVPMQQFGAGYEPLSKRYTSGVYPLGPADVEFDLLTANQVSDSVPYGISGYSGEVVERYASNKPSKSYNVHILERKGGGNSLYLSVHYPELGCIGVLHPKGNDYTEVITHGACETGGTWSFTPQGYNVNAHYESASGSHQVDGNLPGVGPRSAPPSLVSPGQSR